jgi:hypothetical protein
MKVLKRIVKKNLLTWPNVIPISRFIPVCLAFEIFDEKRSISSPPTVPSSSKADGASQTRSKSINVAHDQSSISEEPSLHEKFQPSYVFRENEIFSN